MFKISWETKIIINYKVYILINFFCLDFVYFSGEFNDGFEIMFVA